MPDLRTQNRTEERVMLSHEEALRLFVPNLQWAEELKALKAAGFQVHWLPVKQRNDA